MFCILWVIFQIMALLVGAGGSSGSAEAAGNRGGNGGLAGNNPNPGRLNGVPGNGQPFLAQLVPVGGGFLIQQPGALVGQVPMPQLVPFGSFQPVRALPVGQVGAANGGMQPQGQLPQLANGGMQPQGQLPQLANGAIPLFAILSQANALGGPPSAMLIPGQQVQIIPLNGGNIPQPPAVGGNAAGGKVRVKHSVAAHPRRLQVVASEVEESSGVDTEEELTN